MRDRCWHSDFRANRHCLWDGERDTGWYFLLSQRKVFDSLDMPDTYYVRMFNGETPIEEPRQRMTMRQAQNSLLGLYEATERAWGREILRVLGEEVTKAAHAMELAGKPSGYGSW